MTNNCEENTKEKSCITATKLDEYSHTNNDGKGL